MVCSLGSALPDAAVHGVRACCTYLMMVPGFACSALQAQPDYQLSRILFEPHPVPAMELAAYTSADATAMETIVADSGHSFAAAAPYSRFSFADRAAGRELVTDISEEDRATAEAAIEAYRDTIIDTESEAGPFSSALFEQLLGLGEAYQRLDQHEEALATLEKAEYISRINNGLIAPDQFAVVEQMVDSLMASGDMQEAMKKQQYLLYLNTQFYGYDSKQLVPALEQLGDWSMEAFESGVHGSTWQGFVVSRSSGVPGLTPFAKPRPNMSPRGQAIMNLDSAQRRYYQAISNLLDANDFQNPELLELEEKLQKSVYFSAHRNGLMKDPNFYLDARVDATGSRISHPEFTSNMTSFVNARNSLFRTLIYLENTPASDPMARVVTLLNLGDWHAIYNRMYEASNFYRQASELAASMPERRNEWAPLLTPEVPRQLPDFITLPHSRATFGVADEAAVEFDGYIDVKLALSRSGDVRSMRMLKMTDNITPQLAKRLRRLIRAAPYRPLLDEGQPVASERLVRYYFADMREEARI